MPPFPCCPSPYFPGCLEISYGVTISMVCVAYHQLNTFFFRQFSVWLLGMMYLLSFSLCSYSQLMLYYVPRSQFFLHCEMNFVISQSHILPTSFRHIHLQTRRISTATNFLSEPPYAITQLIQSHVIQSLFWFPCSSRLALRRAR